MYLAEAKSQGGSKIARGASISAVKLGGSEIARGAFKLGGSKIVRGAIKLGGSKIALIQGEREIAWIGKSLNGAR